MFSLKCDEKIIKNMREKYPTGKRVRLISMDGEPQMPIGLCGTIKGVDDIGQILVNWDNGSSLALNTVLDVFEVTNVKY